MAASALTDYQTVELRGDDAAWQTSGEPAGRHSAPGTFRGPHIRLRDYHADLRVVVVLSLRPADEEPTVADLAAALRRPARPLFIGRKPCLPSRPLLGAVVKAGSLRAALDSACPAPKDEWVASWPAGSEPVGHHNRRLQVCDARNWHSRLHGGSRTIDEGPADRLGES